MKYSNLIAQMTLEEKAGLCSGKDMWHFKGIDRLAIPSIMVSDGPHGLRAQNNSGVSTQMNVSSDATCFPPASALACSWDRDLAYLQGEYIGKESQAQNVQVVLGPGINIKRSPLCGRNFEYYSEDPMLSGEMGASFVDGVQSQGVGTSLKHYAVNNQETYRMSINAVVDERTMREIYLSAFEKVVKKSNPTTIMASYNLINGTSATEHEYVLNDILYKEWNYKGIVISDWGAVNHRVEGVRAGMHVEMPSSGGMNDELIVEAVKNKKLDESVLDKRVDEILDIIFKVHQTHKKGTTYSIEEHDAIARKIASECIVLLKNNENILPLDKNEKVLIVGEMARSPRFQGAGSSFINCHKITSLLNAMAEEGTPFDFEAGYYAKTRKKCDSLIAKAVEKAKNYSKVIVCVGLPSEYEAEGFDRTNIDLPQSHNKLVQEIAKVNKNTVVVLSGGSVVSMPWINDVKGVVMTYLAGQNSGGATYDVLYGKVNPSGRLSETYPLSLSDIPCSKEFPGNRFNVKYKEGLFVGYRYFESVDAPVLFPFGYGLSYTQFDYSDIELDKKEINADENLNVSLTVSNIGDTDGKEVVQLYVKHKSNSVYMPAIQLKDFKKIFISSKSSQRVSFMLDKRAFAFYDVSVGDWIVESGEYEIAVGRNVRELKCVASVIINGTPSEKIEKTPKSWYTSPDAKKTISDEEFALLFKGNLPTISDRVTKKGNFTADDSIEDMSHTSGLARFLLAVAKPAIRMSMKVDKYDPNYLMIYEVMKTSPIRSLAFSSQGMFNMKMVDGFVTIMNGHFFKGLNSLLKAIKK